MKIDHKLINSFFQMSDVDVQYIQFDIKMKAISFKIISTSCVCPIITASSSLLSFERDSDKPFALSISNLTFSSFGKFVGDFDRLEVGKDYLISMQHEDLKYYKFFYLICPFYRDRNMETVIQMASILSTEDSNVIDVENNQKYPVEFDSTLSLYQFFENCLVNVQVKKIYLNTLMFENKSNTFLIDFTQTSKYLLLINKSKYLIRVYTTDKVNFKIIKATDKKAFSLQELKKESSLDFQIIENEVDNSFYIYIEHLDSAEKIKLYIKTYQSVLQEGSNFFHNFWGYFIIVLASIISLVIVWIIVQRFMNKKRLKKIQQDLDSKLRQQHTHEIQKQSERISVFMMNSSKGKGALDSISGKDARSPDANKIASLAGNTSENSATTQKNDLESYGDSNTSRETIEEDSERYGDSATSSRQRVASCGQPKSDRLLSSSKKLALRVKAKVVSEKKSKGVPRLQSLKEKFISSIENMILKKTKKITEKHSSRKKLNPMTFIAKSKKLARLRRKKKSSESVESEKSDSVEKTEPDEPVEDAENESEFNVIDVRTNN